MGVTMAMVLSCHCFTGMARLALPFTAIGERLLTVTVCGAEKALEEYILMRPIKAAPESCAGCQIGG